MSGGAAPAQSPRHVAVIMDGNGRWARRRGLKRVEGHKQGAKSVEAVVRACRQAGIKYLTLYAFSTENWSRPRGEVSSLMRLLREFLLTHRTEFHQHRIRLRVLGRPEDLPLAVRRALQAVMRETQAYEDYQLILALSYGARDEIVAAARTLARRAAAGEIDPARLSEQDFAAHLYLPDVPDPDLLIRTSGELRLSNFMLWQLSYAELYFTDTLWPDFGEVQFEQALREYRRRRRRFGRVDEHDQTGGAV